jgi:hypothetical protein
LSQLWDGLVSGGHDHTASFVPSDGRGHFFAAEHCTKILTLIERSREPWAQHLRKYCRKII